MNSNANIKYAVSAYPKAQNSSKDDFMWPAGELVTYMGDQEIAGAISRGPFLGVPFVGIYDIAI